MKCADFGILLSDYLDGQLDEGERSRVEAHISGCPACAEMLRDAQAAMAFLERVERPEPPPELITRILFHAPVSGAPAAPEPGSPRGLGARLRGWFSPLLQPRFAMGMAMTILSFSMVGKIGGLPGRQLTLADLEPARVWAAFDDKIHRAWDRAVKYYENLRLVYEIQGRLQEWSAQEEEERRAQSGSSLEPRTPESKAGERRAEESGEGSKKQP